MAVNSNLGAVVGAEEGAVVSIPGNEGGLAQAWVNVRGGLRVFSVYFWHSESWTPRNEALLEAVVRRAKTTRHPWLVACDVNMCPEDFEKSLWFQRELMHVVAPKEVSTCRYKDWHGEWMDEGGGRPYELRPHKVVCFCCRQRQVDRGNGTSRSCRRCCLVAL